MLITNRRNHRKVKKYLNPKQQRKLIIIFVEEMLKRTVF